MTRSRTIVIGLIGVALLGAGVVAGMERRRPAATTAATTAATAPGTTPGVRMRVQVLNGTKTRGLARRATMLLRDRGFDVVEVGTTKTTRDSTVVLDLSGHPEWADRAARLFGAARVERRIDSSRYLDIAVLVGSNWRPPTEPFYP